MMSLGASRAARVWRIPYAWRDRRPRKVRARRNNSRPLQPIAQAAATRLKHGDAMPSAAGLGSGGPGLLTGRGGELVLGACHNTWRVCWSRSCSTSPVLRRRATMILRRRRPARLRRRQPAATTGALRASRTRPATTSSSAIATGRLRDPTGCFTASVSDSGTGRCSSPGADRGACRDDIGDCLARRVRGRWTTRESVERFPW